MQKESEENSQELQCYESKGLMSSKAQTCADLAISGVGTKSPQGISRHQPASSHRPFVCFRTSDTSTGFLAWKRSQMRRPAEVIVKETAQ